MTAELARMPSFTPPEENKAMGRAFGMALLLEILPLAALFYGSQRPDPVTPAMPPVELTLVAPEMPKPAAPPTGKPVPQPTPPPKSTLRPPPAPRPESRELPPPSPIATQQPTTPEAVATPPPSPVVADPRVQGDYLAQVKVAIQAAVRFPENARMLGEEGKVQLRFLLHDGQIGDVEILRHGAMEVFDRAAIAALQNASLPGTPQDLTGKNFTLTVWVEFRLHRD